jgi:hypothetical protein
MSDQVERARQCVDFLNPALHRSFIPTLHFGLRRGGRVVYCGGLENRFGFTADGGSNPSLSAIVEL